MTVEANICLQGEVHLTMLHMRMSMSEDNTGNGVKLNSMNMDVYLSLQRAVLELYLAKASLPPQSTSPLLHTCKHLR